MNAAPRATTGVSACKAVYGVDCFFDFDTNFLLKTADPFIDHFSDHIKDIRAYVR